ncbi:sensor domain-containing diguanylate cyclase (plasmid) [Klebsiella michiganensis]|uniref:sensor domain-containing diguanylate cyclase n=1 Tax=Klebsiella michiganensis TaxID=1134687 RepID=UPI0026588B91|nr:sensor domain-containing diguanylate cyclase [Klebsiella michiganensis]WKJ95800.1 sensor domain-containing diguanylate cyclase [Klebsiella michiganensis]WKK01061.1 sensor domain-containing diguanylate cyclase [Klebsiella michiganensis]WKK02854.1 sensor domain-containing diguanylate cyclase [Klebsiella michiganensis]WKK07024.1 sensor domain-containing diguanylate cyclase [Klebsiella michiganensis]
MLKKKPYLRPLLITLTTGGVILTSVLLIGSMLFFQKRNIEDSLLKSNQAYALKLADTIDSYFASAQRQLAWSARQINSLDDIAALQYEVGRIGLQSGLFNSVAIVNADAVLLSSSPDYTSLVDGTLHSAARRQALSSQVPFISPPFISKAGNEIIFISHPIFAYNGFYLGYLSGSVYLKKASMLRDILSMHFHGDDITITVVNSKGVTVFSQVPTLMGTPPPFSPELKPRLSANGLRGVFGFDGTTESLSGYASLSQADWNITVSTSREVVTRMLMQTVAGTAGFILGIIILTGGLVALLSTCIARPLEQLAGRVRASEGTISPERFSAISAWYQEADLLRNAMAARFRTLSDRVALLRDEAITDPLTGLYNRRGINERLLRLNEHKCQYVIAVDIDNFKSVNDRFGHDTGDAMLVHVADLLSQTCHGGDIISRFGGEEFIILLPNSTLYAASILAERIRATVAGKSLPIVGHLTVSVGVSGLRECGGDRDVMLKTADQALYQAKREGRNRVVLGHAASSE